MKNFLLTRQPIRTFNTSNGRARLAGWVSAKLPVFGNIFVNASQTIPESQMRAKLIERVKAAGLKYGVVVRRLDFPSTAAVENLRSMAAQLQKGGGGTRSLTAPLVSYRVYTDGREELVRGLRFRDFRAKDLRDLAAASDHPYILNHVNNGDSFNWANATVPANTPWVICPSLLFGGFDLDRAQGDDAKPPLVPGPSLAGQ